MSLVKWIAWFGCWADGVDRRGAVHSVQGVRARAGSAIIYAFASFCISTVCLELSKDRGGGGFEGLAPRQGLADCDRCRNLTSSVAP
jgi:hypothetical protein